MQDEHALSRVGLRLRAAINARGETLRSFSDRSGIPYRSLQEYVAGKNKPGFEQLQKIATSGVDVGFLLTGTYSGQFLKVFSEGAKHSLLLSSDGEFSKLIYDGLLSAIDDINIGVVSRQGSPLTVQRITEILSYGLSMALSVVGEMEQPLVDLRARGVSASAVASIVLEAVAKKLETEIAGAA
ncbi:MAG: helix-turn-helix domain-containing protein [Caulobacter sp.]